MPPPDPPDSDLPDSDPPDSDPPDSGLPDASSPGAGVVAPATPEEAAFVQDLVARGQAAERGPDGQLPSGATHEIVGRTETGLPIVRRVRFAGRPY